MVSVDSTATTYISLSWSVASGSVVESYEVKWSSDQCPEDHEEDSNTTISGNSASNTISNLRPGTSYTVAVIASNSAGQTTSGNITVEIEETSMFCAFCSTTYLDVVANQCLFTMALFFSVFYVVQGVYIAQLSQSSFSSHCCSFQCQCD